MKWFTSDLHFAHPFVAALRGYALPGYAKDASIKQQAEHEHKPLKNCVDWRRHDADIIRSINTYVGEEDELYILGDISPGGTWSVEQAIMRIQNLQVPRKRRHLILGNHELHSSSRTLEKLASVFGEVGRVGITEIVRRVGQQSTHGIFKPLPMARGLHAKQTPRRSLNQLERAGISRIRDTTHEQHAAHARTHARA